MTIKSGELIYGLDEIEKAVDLLLPLFEKYSIITFTGSLGAGKTTLVQALLKRAGIEGPIPSPTFALVNEYKIDQLPLISSGDEDTCVKGVVSRNQSGTSTSLSLYHFDLYRLGSAEEFSSSGFDEYLSASNSKSLIEWPGIIMPLLTKDACHIELDYDGLEKRSLTFKCFE